MPIPVLKLNLAPPPTLWRQKHEALGWAAIAVGGLCLAGTLGYWGSRLYQARKSAKAIIALSKEADSASKKQQRLVEQLRDVDVTNELPRWKLAERILTERTLPWSRLTAELERSLVQDVRLKAIQKVRGSDQRVSLKLKGESRTREAEEKFVASLQKDDLFQQVVLEREAERNGGGVDFELNLPVVDSPSPYQPFQEPERAQPSAAPAVHPGVKPAKANGRPGAASGPSAPAAQPSLGPQRQVLPTAQPSRPNPRPQGRPEPSAQPSRQPEPPPPNGILLLPTGGRP